MESYVSTHQNPCVHPSADHPTHVTLHPTQGRTPRLRALLESGLAPTARPHISPDQHLKHPEATTRTVKAQEPRPGAKLAPRAICGARLGSPELFSERLNLNLTERAGSMFRTQPGAPRPGNQSHSPVGTPRPSAPALPHPTPTPVP